ncbi:MAG: hypothetical protein VX589_17965 [Myxococcota bacterium]|nr:hypothetical protein [Myxococcota bacterium]
MMTLVQQINWRSQTLANGISVSRAPGKDVRHPVTRCVDGRQTRTSFRTKQSMEPLAERLPLFMTVLAGSATKIQLDPLTRPMIRAVRQLALGCTYVGVLMPI